MTIKFHKTILKFFLCAAVLTALTACSSGSSGGGGDGNNTVANPANPANPDDDVAGVKPPVGETPPSPDNDESLYVRSKRLYAPPLPCDRSDS